MSVCIVVVTYNRADYVNGLLDSIGSMGPAPDAVVVVDNASTDHTAQVLRDFADSAAFEVIVERMSENLGGAGGFRAGVERALRTGADWLWLMDDDVEVLPDALARIAPYLQPSAATDGVVPGAVHGRRVDHDGSPFFWQHRFNAPLGVHLPVRGNVFAHGSQFRTDVGCFEGMLLNADTARRMGAPDGRFFLVGDDVIYGWLVSRNEPVTYVDEVLLRKTRPQRQIDLGVRHLSDSSDMSRYYSMRNRGLFAQYLRANGEYRPLPFAVGTALTAGKEAFRMLAVERRVSASGVSALWRGWRAGSQIRQDRLWEPEVVVTEAGR